MCCSYHFVRRVVLAGEMAQLEKNVLCRPASVVDTVTNSKRICVKQGGRWGLLLEIVLWLPHACLHTHTSYTHIINMHKKYLKSSDLVFCPKCLTSVQLWEKHHIANTNGEILYKTAKRFFFLRWEDCERQRLSNCHRLEGLRHFGGKMQCELLGLKRDHGKWQLLAGDAAK